MLHYTNGPFGVLLPYLVSFLGSALGLQSMIRARSLTGTSRFWWLLLAAVSIGGTGIWGMHFIAMLGFGVDGLQITYDAPITAASVLVAVTVVGIGLAIAVRGNGRGQALIVGGTLTGAGVACMHYLGMAAMRLPAGKAYNWTLVAASVGIAVIAATAALWATTHIRGMAATIGAALVMAAAVCGMHYTGMAALRVGAVDPMLEHYGTPGLTSGQLLAPLIIGVGATSLIMIFLVVLAPPEHELRSEAELRSHLDAIRSGRTPDPVRASGRRQP